MADSKSSGTDTVVKVVLIFFISLLSFSIGTFVGKKFSDNQHKMAVLEPQAAPKESAAHHDEGAKEEHHEAQEPEVALGAKVSEHNKKAKPHAEEEVTEEQASSLEDEMVDEDLKKGAKNDSSKKLNRMLASEMAQKGVGKYTVQIASFSSQEEAEKKVQELKAQKFDSFSTETTVQGHQWYRVNVGLFATIKEAQNQKTQLADQAKITKAIIQKVSK